MTLHVDRLEALLIATHLDPITSGEELVIICPLCQDGKPRLYISTEHGRWICFHCHERGHLGQLLTEVCGLEGTSARQMERRIKRPAVKPGLDVRPKATVEGRLAVHPPAGYLMLHEYMRPGNTHVGLARPYLEYLYGRGVTDKDISKHMIGFCVMGAYAGRIIIPVKVDGEVVTWQARAIGDEVEPKTLNCPGTRAGSALFNIDNIQPPWVVLVEGPFDALRLPDLAVATLGSRLSKNQRRHLKRKGFSHVIIMRDADDTGQRSAVEDAMELVSAGFSVYIAPLPLGVYDPGEASDEDLRWSLANAKPVEDILGFELLQEAQHGR
jgi:DNA primase